MNETYLEMAKSSYKPRKQAVTQQTIPEDKIEISESELSRLESLTNAELIALVKRMACQCGLVATMSEEETAQAMLDTLANTALKPIIMGVNVKADIQSRMNAIDKWLDRKKGKPVQALDMNVKDDRMQKMEIDKLIRLAAMLDEPIIIPPMPAKE